MKVNSRVLFLMLLLFIVFIFYFPSVFFAIKAFDELKLFQEAYLPVCVSIRQLTELISLLGLKNHFEAANSLYSNISSIRCDPLANFLQLVIQLLFQKNAFLYHLHSLILHIINTAIIFLILEKACFITSCNKNNKLHFITSILTLLWALHPVNVESVLLATNTNALIGYTFSLLIIFLFLSSFINKTITSWKTIFILFTTFLPALFTTEFNFMLPVILFFYCFAVSTYQAKDKPLAFSIRATIPLITATAIFIVLFISSGTKINLHSQSFDLALERIFWLSPQIIFHFTKLLLFPVNLSIDQTLLVKISRTYLDFHFLICIFFILSVITLAFYSLSKAQKQFPVLFITCFLYLLALAPYSHIFAPLYNLASERYLYFPSFILIFGLCHFLSPIVSQNKNKKNYFLIITVLLLTVLIYSTRSFFRLLDWKDSYSLYYSAIQATDNPLAKGFRYKTLIPQEKNFSPFPHREVSKINQELALINLKKAVRLYKSLEIRHKDSVPKILKPYGLDPATLSAKSSYLLAHTKYLLNDNPDEVLESLKPYVENRLLSDSGALAFYASLLVRKGLADKAEEIYRLAYKYNPFSTQIIFPLCQLIYMKTGNLEEVEKICQAAFKYFPYDSYTLLFLIKINQLKDDKEKFAYYSYIYGLRQNKTEFLQNAYEIYTSLGKSNYANRVLKSLKSLGKP